MKLSHGPHLQADESMPVVHKKGPRPPWLFYDIWLLTSVAEQGSCHVVKQDSLEKNVGKNVYPSGSKAIWMDNTCIWIGITIVLKLVVNDIHMNQSRTARTQLP